MSGRSFFSWLRGGCWHRWGGWGEPEQLTLGRKGREVLPGGTVLRHGERVIMVRWRQCERCHKWDGRHQGRSKPGAQKAVS